ncbi:MAG: hypothetical protein ACYDAY_11980 [Candidatus Dormibacteria bacterium]
MTETRIALGLALGREVDSLVFLRWLQLLRHSPWLGPIFAARGMYVVQARNMITAEALASPDPWTHLLMWDSDQLPPAFVPGLSKSSPWWPEPGTFTEYVSHAAAAVRGVIGGLYFSRDTIASEGRLPHEVIAYRRDPDGGYFPIPTPEMYMMMRNRGFYDVDAVGTGCMVIRRELLAALSEDGPAFSAPQMEDGSQWTEDMDFCARAKARGETIWLDTAMESGHRGDVWISGQHYLAVRQRPAPAAPRSKILSVAGTPLERQN